MLLERYLESYAKRDSRQRCPGLPQMWQCTCGERQHFAFFIVDDQSHFPELGILCRNGLLRACKMFAGIVISHERFAILVLSLYAGKLDESQGRCSLARRIWLVESSRSGLRCASNWFQPVSSILLKVLVLASRQ